MNKPIRIAVTGAAGNISYSLLFRLASGAIFGSNQPVILHLIEIEPAMKALEGVAMELDDCAFPTLKGLVLTSDLNTGFDGVNWALLIGSVPRKAGMERKDLLNINGKIFIGQGQAIQKNAASDVKVLVVGNPCNTNCYIAMNNAKDIPANRWFAMTRLDENRAKAQLAKKAGVAVSDVSNMVIWGNHSSTQYPDFYNAKIQGKPVIETIEDEAWLKNAASAANAALETVVSLETPTHPADWTSVAVCSDGSYGIEKGLICSLPIRVTENGWSIVQDLPINEFGKAKIEATVNELKEEAASVADLVK